MTGIATLMIVVGLAGAWGGPSDPEHVEDWGLWFFFIVLLVGGMKILYIEHFMVTS